MVQHRQRYVIFRSQHFIQWPHIVLCVECDGSLSHFQFHELYVVIRRSWTKGIKQIGITRDQVGLSGTKWDCLESYSIILRSFSVLAHMCKFLLASWVLGSWNFSKFAQSTVCRANFGEQFELQFRHQFTCLAGPFPPISRWQVGTVRT